MSDHPSYRLIAAGLILLTYFIVAGVLLARMLGAGVPPGQWEHVVVIFNAVGALATTAAGVLFGAEVQQANVRSAQHDSQVQAARAARKEQAAVQALEALEFDPAAGPVDGTGRARLILQRALGPDNS